MRVGFVIDMDYPHPGEVRPRKLAQSLHARGHEISFLCANSRTRPDFEDIGYGRVFRFDLFTHSGLFRFLAAPAPVNPAWVYWVYKVAKRERLDVLVTSNIRIAIPAILAARLLGIPVVVDLQENNAEVVRVRPRTRLAHYITRNGYLVGALENLCVRLADHTWVVIEERMQALPPALANSGKVSVVCHTPDTNEIRVGSEPVSKDPRIFRLAYVGLFAPGHGSVELVLQAMPELLKYDKGFRVAIGGGRQLEPFVRELGVEDYVEFAGMILPEQVCDWLRRSDVGVICYDVNAFTNTTISNKLFYYMAVGIPTLSTDMAPTRRIIDTVGCGVVIPQGSTPKDVAELILQMRRSPQECAAMGRRGREAILSTYNWEKDSQHALEVLQRLVQRSS